MNDRIVVPSPAKINWNLRVVRRRPDGFHEIASLVSTVSFHDELAFCDTSDGRIVLVCDHPDVPTDGRNLVFKAVELVRSRCGLTRGVHCEIVKQIPIGGGVGGGSSNAAATLIALNQLWSLDWSEEELASAAADIGSDVALFMRGGSVVMTGRGEHVRPVRLPWSGWIVLILPPLSVSTAAVYRAWRPGAETFENLPIEGSPADNSVDWMAGTFNMLEPPAFEVCPDLGKLFDQLGDIADRPVRMSGSGSTLFTAFDSRAEADSFAEHVRRALRVPTRVVQPVEEACGTAIGDPTK